MAILLNLVKSRERRDNSVRTSHLVDATFLDSAVVVQMLNRGTAITYQQSSKTPLMLIFSGMFIKPLALRVQSDKRGANVCGDVCSDPRNLEGFLTHGREQS